MLSIKLEQNVNNNSAVIEKKPAELLLTLCSDFMNNIKFLESEQYLQLYINYSFHCIHNI